MKKLAHMIASYMKQTDIWLWLICISLTGFSAILIFGIATSETYPDVGSRRVLVQLGASGIGAIFAIFLSKRDYHVLTKLWKIHAPVAYILVGLTFFLGTGTQERLSDKSWFRLPGGLNFQPSEILKISFILTLAYHLYSIHDELNRPQNVIAVCLHGALPVLLIHFQGDDGSALIFAFIFIAMVFAAGLSWRYIVPALCAGVLAIPLVWVYLLNDYQRQRFLILFDPNASPLGDLYQQFNAKLAIGSGQLWGKGIFVENHKYVPAAHTDFIFAFIGESLGFVGCLAVILIILTLCVKILTNAHRAEDLEGRLICSGVFAMFAAQAIINIGMCISVLPVIGITLPFLSYGGSSSLASYIAIGLVLSVYMNTSKPLFSE